MQAYSPQKQAKPPQSSCLIAPLINDKYNYQMKQQNSKECGQDPISIYRLLPQARPLHNKTYTEPKSAFRFVGESPPSFPSNQLACDQQLMETIEDDRNQGVHAIGSQLSELFKDPVYQSYDNLILGEDNSKFATCRINLDDPQQIKPAEVKPCDESCLVFESRFQSGNLAVASRSEENPNQYFLALQRDTNSHATCQWYYFYVQNRGNTGTFTFNIVNFVKNYSAYENGMKPCVYSLLSGQGWRRDGFQIHYRRSSLAYKNQRNYYSLQYSYRFRKQNDRIYFAYSYPYSFSRLQTFLNQIQSNHSSLAQIKVLTKTLKDNPVNIISITNSQSHVHDDGQKKKNKKDMIMICARVHPGETISSFACQFFVRFLLGESVQASNIRMHYIVKIIPFLNPDGVIHGNYRTSLSGNDLNRRWKRPDKDIHPQIWSIKRYLQNCGYKKALFIDLHGHSKKRSSFMYGCLNRQNPYLCKQFPFILSKESHQFCYYNCNFSTPAARQGTSRLNLWKQFKVDHSYTMEISFCGPVRSRNMFTVRDYCEMGTSLGRVMSLYFCGKKAASKKIQEMLNQLYSDRKLKDMGNEESSGSQSGEEELAVVEAEKKQEKISISSTKEQLGGILNRYLNETKMKWCRRQAFQPKVVIRKEEFSEPNLRARKELSPSRISIQKIDLSEQITNPYFAMGFIRGSMRITGRQLKGLGNRQFFKGTSTKKSYGPYSANKIKAGKASSFIDEPGLMLPKVLREQQLKYRRYRRNECNFEISLNEEQSQKLNSRTNHHISREISLAEKIFQSTHKQMQETSRYWMRNS